MGRNCIFLLRSRGGGGKFLHFRRGEPVLKGSRARKSPVGQCKIHVSRGLNAAEIPMGVYRTPGNCKNLPHDAVNRGNKTQSLIYPTLLLTQISSCSFRLTWSLPPHSPAGAFAGVPSFSHAGPLRRNDVGVSRPRAYSTAAGRTYTKPHHAQRPSGVFLFGRLTWVVSPAAGIDFQPQTRKLQQCYYTTIVYLQILPPCDTIGRSPGVPGSDVLDRVHM